MEFLGELRLNNTLRITHGGQALLGLELVLPDGLSPFQILAFYQKSTIQRGQAYLEV